MKKIVNPYDKNLNNCFGCSTKNPFGLKLRFIEDNELFLAKWEPTENFEGYQNVLHGGIIAALLDETGAWCVSVKMGTACVTSRMTTEYLAPVYINKGVITLKASIAENTDRNVKVNCLLYDGKEKLCAEAVAEYFIYPLEIAVRKFKYPGREAFYGEE